MTLVYPFLVQVFLTLFISVILGVARVSSVQNKEVRVRDIAVSNDTWPTRARLISNNFSNQFETPVLFYALVLMALHLGMRGQGMVVLAWIYVISRLAHTFIHITTNAINARFGVFLVGIVALAAMAVLIVLRALSM